jgi:hypothetical protein
VPRDEGEKVKNLNKIENGIVVKIGKL